MTRPPARAWHPLVLAPYPVLVAYARNADSIYFVETLGPLVVVLAATLVAWVLLRRATGDPARAALLTTAGLLATFAFERNVHAAEVRGWGGTPHGREWLVLVAEVAGLAGWALLVRLRAFPVRALTTAANAGSLALVALLVPGLARAIRAEATTPAARPAPATASTSVAPPPAAGGRPDIYFLVLDAFGRSDILARLFDLDDGDFIEGMRRRGFVVAGRSTANYCQTALSISATLDGRYHDALRGSDSKSRLPLRDLMAQTEFGAILRERGYRFVAFASGFGLTDGFPADRRLAPPGDLPEFAALVLDMTPTWVVLGQGAGAAAHRRHRARIEYLFDHLADVADDPAPTFCLAHVVAPHPPFVFGRDGRDVSAASAAYRLTDGRLWSDMDGHGGPDDYARRYRDQAGYIADRVERAVDQILAKSPTPPVIIIQGDHGPGSHFDSDSAVPNDLDERMGILNLCLVPAAAARQVAPTMTPINTFRVVGDAVFGTRRGLVPDRNYYSSYQAPYRLTDVTAEVARTLLAPASAGEGR